MNQLISLCLNKKSCVCVGFEWHFKNECSRSISFFSTILVTTKIRTVLQKGTQLSLRQKSNYHSYPITQLLLFCLNLPHWFICSPPWTLVHIIFNEQLKWYHSSIQKHLLLSFIFYMLFINKRSQYAQSLRKA